MKNEDDVIGNEITGGGSSSSGPLKSLLEVCPICGKEFSCNKTYHVYTALAGRRRLLWRAVWVLRRRHPRSSAACWCGKELRTDAD